MDIEIIVRKGLVYSALSAVTTTVFFLVVYLCDLMLKNITGYNIIFGSIPAVILLTLSIYPMKERIQLRIDNIFYADKNRFRKAISKMSAETARAIDMSKITELILGVLPAELGLKYALLNMAPERYEEQGERNKNEIILPVTGGNKTIANLFLGPKSDAEPYTEEEKTLLGAYAVQLGVSIENASLHEKILKDQKELLLADKLSTVGRFAAGLAHEIKNPLAAIKGMSQGIDKNMANPEYIRDFKEVVPKEIDRINQLVDNLLSLTKTKELSLAKVSLNDLLEDILKIYGTLCKSRNITVKKDFASVPDIQADPGQLNQVFTNLLLNAIAAMPDGGELSVKTSARENRVIVEVADTGTGIPQEKLKDIFEPFFSTKQDGLGLGLAITRKIIQDHGGMIEVESPSTFAANKAGKGTRFRVKMQNC